MSRKQAAINDSSAAAAAPARAAKPRAPRVNSAKHAKTASGEAGVPEAAAAAPVLQMEMIETVIAPEFTPPSQAIAEADPLVAAAIEKGQPAANAVAAVDGDAREEIARIAYGYWLERGCAGGDPVADWVRAENEYRSRIFV